MIAPITCEQVYVIDGDTIACGNFPAHIRLLGIDAPEMPGHCHGSRVCTPGDGPASRRIMQGLVARGAVQCQPEGYDHWRRILSRCSVGDIDLSCQMVRVGAAVYRYSHIDCPAYRRLERPWVW
jgi:micrococcal nuclease